jgi:Ni/Co efflux regulator RcnB
MYGNGKARFAFIRLKGIRKMKRIAGYFLAAAGFATLAAAPGAFAADFHNDHIRHERGRVAIRHDERRLHRDLERGHYREAARDRAVLRRDERWR